MSAEEAHREYDAGAGRAQGVGVALQRGKTYSQPRGDRGGEGIERLAWSMRTPNCLHPVAVLPE